MQVTSSNGLNSVTYYNRRHFAWHFIQGSEPAGSVPFRVSFRFVTDLKYRSRFFSGLIRTWNIVSGFFPVCFGLENTVPGFVPVCYQLHNTVFSFRFGYIWEKTVHGTIIRFFHPTFFLRGERNKTKRCHFFTLN